jgi:glyoxylase-like metal-dependent hydrolase (beta-lactamase superfamily II)
MAAKKIKNNVYEISLVYVNAFLLVGQSLTIIDTGTPGSASKILRAVEDLGFKASQIEHILVTHFHGDHTGGLADLKTAAGAPVYMHPVDAEMVRRGTSMRPSRPGPGLINALIGRLFLTMGARFASVASVEIEHEIQEGQRLDFAGGMQVVHVPGHSAGQVSFLWPHDGGVLFAADTASNMFQLGFSIVYEDIEEGKRSLAKLCGLEFETACFGHGRAITCSADERFREKWGGA